MEIGSWIETPRYGRAVLVELQADSAVFRYRARRCVDSKIIWVLSSDLVADVQFKSKPTSYTLRIVKLKGPYGEGPILPPMPPAVVPASIPDGMVRATTEEMFEIMSALFSSASDIKPSADGYDPVEAAPVFAAWDRWSQANREARLAEIGWTLTEWDAAMIADAEAFYASLG